MEQLIELGGDVNFEACAPNDPDSWTTLLEFAIVKRFSVSVVRDLLDLGADVNGRFFPTIFAALYAQDDLVELLLAHGADPDARDADGAPLHRALSPFFKDERNGSAYADTEIARTILEKRKKIVSMLVEKGAGVNAIRASTNTTPLDVALGVNTPRTSLPPDFIIFLRNLGFRTLEELNRSPPPTPSS